MLLEKQNIQYGPNNRFSTAVQYSLVEQRISGLHFCSSVSSTTRIDFSPILFLGPKLKDQIYFFSEHLFPILKCKVNNSVIFFLIFFLTSRAQIRLLIYASSARTWHTYALVIQLTFCIY